MSNSSQGLNLARREITMSKDHLEFVWCDYDPITMGYIEKWLDESAVKSTGLDEGFRSFY